MNSYRTHVTILAAFVAASAGWFSTASAQTASVSIDRRLPPDTYAYISIPSVPELKKRFKASSFGELLRDKAFAKFLKDVEVAIKKGSAQIEKEIGLKLDDLLEIPAGEIAVAVGKSKRTVPAITLFVDFGKKEVTVEKLLTLGRKAAKANGLKRSEVAFQGTKIVVYTKPAQGGAEDEGGCLIQDEKKGMDFAYFIKGSFFVFGTDVDYLKAVITRWDGKHTKTFAVNPVYKYIKTRTATGRAPAFTWYIDPLGLAQSVFLNNPDAPFQAKMAFSMLQGFGITKFKAVGGSLDMVVGEYESVNKTVMYVDLPATGVLNLFKFPPVSQTPPKWVPASIATYTDMNWNFVKAYAAAANLYGTISLGGPEALGKKIEEWAKDPNGPKVHLKKDIVDNLNGRIRFMYDFTNPDDATTMRAIVALGLKNEKKTNAVLEKVAALPAFPGKSRKFGETKIYELEIEALRAFGSTSLGIAVTKGNLMVCTNVKLLEQVIKSKGTGKSLSDTAAYKRIAAKFPKKTSMISFESTNTQIQTAYDQIRNGGFGEAVGVDFSKLPPFSAVAKYLRSSGSYAVPDKHGVYLEGFSLRKKK